MVSTPTLPGHTGVVHDNTVVLTGALPPSVGSVQCKGAKTQLWDNRYYTPSGNISLCNMPLSDAQEKLGMDVGSTVSLQPADETILAWARELLGISTPQLQTFLA